MKIDTSGIRRFLKYSVIGGTTFSLDLMMLFLLSDSYGWNPVPAAGAAFVVAVSLNYFLSRRYVFRGSLRPADSGYGIFLLIAGSGFLLVMGLMSLLVEVFGWNYLFSRVLIAFITGFWNYLLNLYVNFRVAGKHSQEEISL